MTKIEKQIKALQRRITDLIYRKSGCLQSHAKDCIQWNCVTVRNDILILEELKQELKQPKMSEIGIQRLAHLLYISIPESWKPGESYSVMTKAFTERLRGEFLVKEQQAKPADEELDKILEDKTNEKNKIK